MPWKKAIATAGAVVSPSGMKQPLPESQSVTVMMVEQPLSSGSPVIKLIWVVCHGSLGHGIGWYRPTGF